jgi:hypothetical protein
MGSDFADINNDGYQDLITLICCPMTITGRKPLQIQNYASLINAQN